MPPLAGPCRPGLHWSAPGPPPNPVGRHRSSSDNSARHGFRRGACSPRTHSGSGPDESVSPGAPAYAARARRAAWPPTRPGRQTGCSNYPIHLCRAPREVRFVPPDGELFQALGDRLASFEDELGRLHRLDVQRLARVQLVLAQQRVQLLLLLSGQPGAGYVQPPVVVCPAARRRARLWISGSSCLSPSRSRNRMASDRS